MTGELKMRLPIGLAYTGSDKVVRDPDQQIQQSLVLIFQLFRQTGSTCGVAKAFRERQLFFPRRPHIRPNPGELVWGELDSTTVLRIIHNPRYAGMFVFGRSRTTPQATGGHSYIKIPKEDWEIVIPTYILSLDGERFVRPSFLVSKVMEFH